MRDERPVFQFNGYVLDVARGCLRTGDREIELRPKSFEVLRCLVENAGRLVTKDELLKAVWPNVVVSDEALTQCISEVREAIGDRGQTMIKTMPRRGYRFVAHVSQGDPTDYAAARLRTAGRVEIAGSEGARRGYLSTERPSIAVLPFINLSGDPQQEYFSDGITDDIITELSRFSELSVISRNSVFQYKGKTFDVRHVGRELGVLYVLEGSVRRDAGRVRINAQLIDSVTGTHCWAERYDRELSSVFAVQDEVTRAIVTVIAIYVNRDEAERSLLKPPATLEAYDYYLRGAKWWVSTDRSAAIMHDGRRLIEKCLSIDPNYARGYVVLARSYISTYLEPIDSDYLRPTGLDHAHELARKAVGLDTDLAQAHAVLGVVLLFQRRHDAAIAEFERALSLNPNFVDNLYGLCLAFAGEPARAVEVLQANLRLDPFQNATRLGYFGHAFYLLKRYDDAVPPLRESAWRMPNLRIVHLWLAASHSQLGQMREAFSEADEVRRIEPDFTIDRWKSTAVYRNPADAEHLFDGLRKAGLRES